MDTQSEKSRQAKQQEPSKAQRNPTPTASQSNAPAATDNAPASTSDIEAGQQPRLPQPARPGQFRRGQMVALATAVAGQQKPLLAQRLSSLETGGLGGGGAQAAEQTLVGVPTEARIELASGVLQPTGRVTMMPPKRPSYLPPARQPVDPRSAYAVHHHRFQPTTSLGATALSSSANAGKPNRYSWAQMQQWHAAQSAAAAAAAAEAEARAISEQAGGRAGGGGFHYHFSSPFSSAASRVLLVPNPIVNLSEHTKSRLVKFIEAIKRFSEKWFSHVLLLMFLASYACLGAYIFISFEAPNEQWEKQVIIETRLRIVNESYEQAHGAGSREAYVDLFRAKFEEYERMLNRVCQSGMTSSSLENQWTFWGALFYSMTVFTTIGYGHLTPITFAGRVATMIYAIFGIPILLMVLADLGKLLTRIIKYAFKKSRFWYSKLLGRKASVRTRQLITDNTNQYIGQARLALERGFATYIQPYQSRIPNAFRSKAAADQHLQQQHRHPHHLSRSNFEPMLESSDIIVTPAGQSKPVSPQSPTPFGSDPERPPQLVHSAGQEQQQQLQQPADSSRPHQSSSSKKATRKISAASRPHKHSVTRSSSASNIGTASSKLAAGQAPQKAKRASLDQLQQQLATQGKQDAEHLTSASDLSPQHELGGSLEHDLAEFVDELDDELDIPVSFALFLLITYMMFGAVVFSIWESWNFFDSLYFVFISMSTIGFGDLVPQHPKRMIGTFAYLLFGLALTSMCINVVQEKIHATFLRAKMQIGEKMGFDLDQIMADDYYDNDQGAYEDADCDNDRASCGNSVAVSQTNSTTGCVSNDHQAAAASVGGPAAASSAAPSTGPDSQQTQAPRHKDSVRSKKRAAAGGEQQWLGSVKRKSSSGGTKKMAAAARQHLLQQQQLHQTQQLHMQLQAHQQPIRPQVETIRMLNMPAMVQLASKSAAAGVAPAPEPSINQPVDGGGMRAFCAPLSKSQAAVGASTQAAFAPPKPTATRSQPSSPAFPRQPLSLNHHDPNESQPYQRSPGATHAELRQFHNQTQRQRGAPGPALSKSGHRDAPESRSRSSAGESRSLGSSRRASVSHELNQLDDLILALSRSPTERFGPLLGIPASRSPSTTRASSTSTAPRRGTSLMVRNSPDAAKLHGSRNFEKKSSLACQTPPFMTPTGSNNLSPATSASDWRRLTASAICANAQQELARRRLRSSESQAALDEHEAVKFSAV